MQLSVEILDRIFSFLVSNRGTLVACSQDPILSPIVERHLYCHLLVQIMGSTKTNNDTFEPIHLSKLVSEKPHILYYVQILQIQLESEMYDYRHATREQMDELAKTLPMFPVLESIIFTTPTDKRCGWHWSDRFRAALENLLSLPTVTELHLLGSRNFPASLLNRCKNIKNLSLSSVEEFEVGRVSDPTLPQLTSLTLNTRGCMSSSLRAWLKCHISELQSLECVSLPREVLPELLGACSETLNKLDLYLTGSDYSNDSFFVEHFPESSTIPKNLQHLIIRVAIGVTDDDDDGYFATSLPAAVDAINLFMPFMPSLAHLVLEIKLNVPTFSDFTQLSFSRLAVLGAASRSIPRIDLYVHTGISPAALTRAQLMISLGDCEGIARALDEGILVIHSEKTFGN